jgi:hypothetical protein
MKIIGMMPVRNEAWVLRHSLACLTGFCDVVLVSDQASEDESRAICKEFQNVVVIEQNRTMVCEEARWHLLDAARDYDGHNLLWCTDADELMSPRLAAHSLRNAGSARPGTMIECSFYHSWNDASHYRDDESPYAPQHKLVAFVDDREQDYDRSPTLPLHQLRIPVADGNEVLELHDLPVLHLQWLLVHRNQMKQAWYRCNEWLNSARAAADINRQYSITLLPSHAKATHVPSEWVAGITYPCLDVDASPSWQELDIRRWFAEHGAAHFEPLEIWHIASLADLFRREVGRRPRSDRSYRPTLMTQARRFAGRAARAGFRRIAF